MTGRPGDGVTILSSWDFLRHSRWTTVRNRKEITTVDRLCQEKSTKKENHEGSMGAGTQRLGFGVTRFLSFLSKESCVTRPMGTPHLEWWELEVARRPKLNFLLTADETNSSSWHLWCHPPFSHSPVFGFPLPGSGARATSSPSRRVSMKDEF